MILLNDRDTGFPIALLQATFLTALRTAAGSGVATAHFAKKDASVLAVYGAGLQAQEHIKAVLSVRPSIQRVHIINRTAPRADELVATLQPLFPALQFTVHALADQSAEAVAALAAAVRSAHVICTTTNSSVALVGLGDVSPGTHINAIGSYLPHMHELSSELVGAARIAIDTPAAFHSGDLHSALEQGVIHESSIRQLGAYVDRPQYSKPLRDQRGEIGFTLHVPSEAATLRTSDRSDFVHRLRTTFDRCSSFAAALVSFR